MSDIGVKLGVEGEAQFKNALKEINTNLKTLGTEMQAVTSAYDRNDKSAGVLTARNQVLNKQIDEQRSKLDLLKAELAESAEEYGENSARTQKLQQDVNRATAALNKSERQLDDNGNALRDVGRGYNDAGQKLDEYGNVIEKVDRKQSAFAGALKGVAVGMAAVMAAAGAAAVALGKEVVSAYADYEQLVGGVDTLFKDSSAAVQEYASNAFKTAGLSANEYMETVTSFSASLIQSLDGDTAKATEYANMAITDMSDNANKMGTDMASIQNAYQGFAKQNYTMLDNLKLGYGGTKSEMERLLVDAGKIAGVEFDISSYADVTEAIHVMQESMGIAGSTAQEAEHTISGSISSMGAAWQNLLVGFGDSDADIGVLAGDLVKSFQNLLKNILPVIENIVKALPVAFAALLPEIRKMLPMLLRTATSLLTQVIDAIVASLPMLIPVAVDALSTIVDTLIDNLPMIINGALTLILALASGMIDALPELIPAVVDTVLTIVDTLIDNIDMLIDAAIAITMALADGLIDAVPMLIEKIPSIIIKLVEAIIENAPKLFEASGQLILQLVAGLSNGFASIFGKIGGWINDNIIQPIKDKVSDFVSAGGDLIAGVWNGIGDKAQWLWDKVSGFFKDLTDKIKNFFGIASPSKLFADEIGGNLAAGVGVGFANQMKTVAKQMSNSIPTDFDIGGNFSAGRSYAGAVGQGSYQGVSQGVSQTVNIYSPAALTPSEIARELKNATRRLAWA